MLHRITQATSKDSLPFKSTKSTQNSDNQHGLPSNNIRILLDVPSETLTGITSYLDPPSLLSLGTVNGHLHKHVNNDNTWHRAFVCQFLGIGPESNVHDNAKCLMLRRSEDSWKGELIVRYNLRRFVPRSYLRLWSYSQRYFSGAGRELATLPLHIPPCTRQYPACISCQGIRF